VSKVSVEIDTWLIGQDRGVDALGAEMDGLQEKLRDVGTGRTARLHVAEQRLRSDLSGDFRPAEIAELRHKS